MPTNRLFQELVRKVAELESLIKRQPKFLWGKVASVNPTLVLLDGDETPSPAISMNNVNIGARVLTFLDGTQRVIIGPGMPDDYHVIPDGRAYIRSGRQTLPKYTMTGLGNGWYGATFDVDPPYVPPEGYFFAYSVLSTSGYNICSVIYPGLLNGKVRLRMMQYGSNAPALAEVTWQLVRMPR